jgi:hypothetical protein
VWVGLWIEGFDGMEENMKETELEIVILRKFMENSFKEDV